MRTLLSAAALLTLASSALAADLPMTKAEPVAYVKICSEFGEGFYYIPGTDTCLSINGYVRADYWWFEPDSRADDGLSFRGRGRVNFDARTATEWGTLRSFVSFEYNRSHPTGNGVRADKAFIQFGGWTAGYATSFYDFYDAEAGNTLYGTYFSSSKTTHLLAYTAVFGNGLSATLSVEDNYYRREGIFSPDDVAFPAIGVEDPYAIYGGQRAPDVVAALRWTQDWGSAQIMAAAHQTRSAIAGTAFEVGSSLFDTGGRSDTEWGWAVGAGVIVNLPSGFFFALEGNYARGAASYAGLGDGKPGNDVIDAAIGAPLLANLGNIPSDLSGDLKLSKAWSVTADLGYNFTPSLVGHIVASYAAYDAPYKLVTPTLMPGMPPAEPQGLADFDAWSVSANLTYTIVKGLTIAGEVSYERRDYDELIVEPQVGSFDDDYDTWAAGIRLKRSF